MKFRVLFYDRRLMMPYICAKFHENTLDGVKVVELNISKGHNCAKAVGVGLVLVLRTSPDNGLYLYRVS